MHELALARNVVSIAEDHARRAGGARVTKVGVRIGPLSGVVPEALAGAFEFARAGTLLEHARLAIERIGMLCRCAACEREFSVDDRFAVAICPTCGQPSGDVLRGTELEVSYLEVA